MKKILYMFAMAITLIGCTKVGKINLRGQTFHVDGKSITLSFDIKERNFYGKAVNNYFGTYDIDGDKITFKLGGTTMMMGPENKMRDEQNFLNSLAKVTSYSFRGTTLTLRGDDDTILKFEIVR